MGSDVAKSYESVFKAHHSEVMRYCVKEYLKDIKGRKNELERVTERFLAVSETLGGVDYSKKLGVDVSSDNNFDDRVIARIEAYQDYLDVLEQVGDYINEAKQLIARIDHGSILWLHYADGVKWQTIALRAKVDARTVRRWRERATEALYRSMPEEYRRYTIPDAQTVYRYD